MAAWWRCALASVRVLLLLQALSQRVEALQFRVPREGRAYDTSEMVYVFERDADEDGYPVLEVDGQRIRAFDFKEMGYEISLMGQQVGKHTAVVRLMEQPEGDQDGSSVNTEIANASVTYTIADPGSGINFMRSSLGDASSGDTRASEEAYERGQALISQAMDRIRKPGKSDVDTEQAADAFREAVALVSSVQRRRFSAALVEALQEATKFGVSLHGIFTAAESHTAETADVLASQEDTEACAVPGDHELDDFFQRIHPINPYEGFEEQGLEYTAGEHQGHDQGMMAALIHVLAPRLIIEVGSHKGGSAIQMASVVKRRGWGCRTKILCVDTWLGTSTDLKASRRPVKNGFPTVYREFMNNILSAGLSSIVVPLPAPANIAVSPCRGILDTCTRPPC